jgi:hypothetical protein
MEGRLEELGGGEHYDFKWGRCKRLTGILANLRGKGARMQLSGGKALKLGM